MIVSSEDLKAEGDRVKNIYREAIRRLYFQLGLEKSQCRKCGADMWWVKTQKGKLNPYTEDGVSHFADCPGAPEFRKPTPPAPATPHP